MQKVAELVSNNCFEVVIGGKTLSFSKVSGFKRKIEYDTIVEGGINDNIHIIQKNPSQAETISLEKGIAYNEEDSKLLKVGKHFDEATIRVIKNGVTVKEYCLYNIMVIEWSLGELDAMSSSIFIQKFEIAYGKMLESVHNNTDIEAKLNKQNKETMDRVTNESNQIKAEKQKCQQKQEERKEIKSKRKKRREIEKRKKEVHKRREEERAKQNENKENMPTLEDLFSI